jgi:hypothetical protein
MREYQFTFPLRSGMSVLGSKALPMAFLIVSMMIKKKKRQLDN